jgi:hypothetical protein
MKRLCCWSAALILAGNASAMAAPALPRAAGFWETTPASQNEEASSAESDASRLPPVSAEAPPPPAPPAATPWTAAPPVAGAGCGHGWGLSGCCERVPSPLDGVWSNYCAQKSHCHPASTFFRSLHVNPHQGAGCSPAPCASPAAPTCDTGDCGHCNDRFGLPKFKMPKLFCSAPACEPACPSAACDACAQPRRSLFGTRCSPACDSYGESVVEEAPRADDFSPAPIPPSPPVEEPPVSDPADVSYPPPGDLPPAVQPSRDARGWLPFPRLKLLPL